MKTISVATQGFNDIVDITDKVQEIIDEEKIKNGLVNLFVIGSTASITTSEKDKNLYEDLNQVLEQIAPYKKNWHHHKTWGDNNGAAHIRASFLGPSLTVPIENRKLKLGTWQSIILIDFDTRRRTREIAVSILKFDI